MNRFDLELGKRGRAQKKAAPDPDPSPLVEAYERVNEIRRRGRAIPQTTPQSPTDMIDFDERRGMEKNRAYSPRSIAAMLARLPTKAVLRVTTSGRGEVIFNHVKANRPEERRIILRFYAPDPGVWRNNTWRTYEEVTAQFTRDATHFYYVGIKRGFWEKCWDTPERLYD